jgi:hypothetical protein
MSAKTQVERDVLAAAQTLGEHQLRELRANARAKKAKEAKDAAAALFESAEIDLAAAELAHAQAHLNVLTCARTKRELDAATDVLLAECEKARLHLWTVASCEDETVILKAACSHGKKLKALAKNKEDRPKADAALAEAQAELQRAHDARAEAARVHAREAEALEDAKRELAQALLGLIDPKAVFGPEAALVDAANTMAGTTDLQYKPYKFAETKDLPIVLPEA